MSYVNISKKSVSCAKKLLSKRSEIVVWGCGNNFNENKLLITQICDVVAVYDTNLASAKKQAEYELCLKQESIKDYADIVLITMSNENGRIEVAQTVDAANLEFVFLEDLIGIKRRQNTLEKYDGREDYFCEFSENDKLRAYIGINIPEYVCNLECRYCYISQKAPRLPKITEMKGLEKYIANALSKKNIGGTALVGLCGVGETLLGDGFVEICLELLRAGHYLHIVTNGLIRDKISELIECSGRYASHIIFKLSFHYEELKERNLLLKFVDNVNLIEKSLASYTIELMPHDEIIDDIDDIIEFSYKYFGALPHVTVGRDDNDSSSLLSKLSYSEYYNTWKIFNSKLFEYKMQMYKKKGRDCYSGRYGLSIDLETGNISRCSIVGENIDNLYEMGKIHIDYEPVGEKCPLEYCYNCHVYGPLGIMCDEKDTYTYLELRDREKANGEHWIKEQMANFLNQKINENFRQ